MRLLLDRMIGSKIHNPDMRRSIDGSNRIKCGESFIELKIVETEGNKKECGCAVVSRTHEKRSHGISI